MKSILYSCVQDGKRLFTNALFWVLSATLVVIVLVVDFALPKQTAEEDYRLVTYHAPAAFSEGEPMASMDLLREAVRNGGTIGVSFDESEVTIVHSGYSDQTLNAVALALYGVEPLTVQTQRLLENAREIPQNLRSTPIFVCFEALMVGFILGGALMLAEKQDGTIRAIRVSPMDPVRYILSKTILFSVIGTIYATLIVIPTIGFSIRWGEFLLLSFVGTAVFTWIGLAFTSPFHAMSGWFFSMVLLLSVNMLPAIGYSSPAFSPFWMKWIPSYPLLTAYGSAMFGNSSDKVYLVLSIAVWGAISFILALYAVQKRHFGEVSA